MGQISVVEAARRLGVSKQRVLKRIAEGAVRAELVGSQWIVDEASLIPLFEAKNAGRPLSERSAWALVALSASDWGLRKILAPSELARARSRLRNLLVHAPPDGMSGEQVRVLASMLRSLLRRRADRRLYSASPQDLPDLRSDNRLALSGLSHPHSGIASGDIVEGYVSAELVDVLVDEYLLMPAASDNDANVILHVTRGIDSDQLQGVALLLLAADLAEHRGPREEARAAELVQEIAKRHHDLIGGVSSSSCTGEKGFGR